jgi:hypothetical protein
MGYTIILYNEENKVLDSLYLEEKPTVEENNIYYSNGALRGINVPFIVIEGEHIPNEKDDISELIPNDKKAELIGEMQNLRSELAQTQQVLNDMMFGGL